MQSKPYLAKHTRQYHRTRHERNLVCRDRTQPVTVRNKWISRWNHDFGERYTKCTWLWIHKHWICKILHRLQIICACGSNIRCHSANNGQRLSESSYRLKHIHTNIFSKLTEYKYARKIVGNHMKRFLPIIMLLMAAPMSLVST